MIPDITALKINIEGYWPEFYREYKDLLAIAAALDVQLKQTQKTVQSAHTNGFVYLADEDGIARYEKEFGIIPAADANLEDRRVEVVSRLNSRTPYTKRVLKRFLDNLVGADGYTMAVDYANHMVKIMIELKRKKQVASVSELLRRVLPANMDYVCQIRYNQLYMLKKFTFTELAKYKISDLKDDPEIKEIFVSRGGELI
jgi:hypothetical protein